MVSKRLALICAITAAVAALSPADVATVRLGRSPASTAPAAAVLPCEGGEGVLQFDLSAVPRDARLFRAELVLWRARPQPANHPDRLVNIEIHALAEPFKQGEPKLSGPPLELCGPGFDRFDATAAVQAALKAKSGAAQFFVKAFPGWDQQKGCLELMYEGRPKDPPAQASGLKVVHRAGQTFITWKEIEDVVGADEVRWGEMRQILNGLDSEREVRYCIYRHSKPIDAVSLPQAQLIARVAPLSCWNVNARNKERPKDEAIAAMLEPQAQAKGPQFWPSGRKGTPEECPIDRFVIDPPDKDGNAAAPLPRATGLLAHAMVPERRSQMDKVYYAVVTMVNGVQNTVSFSSQNATAEPVEEIAAQTAPVLQRKLPPRPAFDYRHTRYQYVQWPAAPQANLPGQYFNWLVCVPEGSTGVPPVGITAVSAVGITGVPPVSGDKSKTTGETPVPPMPVELNLPEPDNSAYRVPYRIAPDSIILVPHDFPQQTWYYGYHDSEGTLKSLKQGTIHNYTQRRMLAFVEFVARTYPVDRNRISVAGTGLVAGSGALHLGLTNPKLFNLVMTHNGCVDFRGAILKFRELGDVRKVPNVQRTFKVTCPQAAIEQLLGKVDSDLKTDSGSSVWDELNLTKYVQSQPAGADLPVVSYAGQGGFEYDRDFRLAMLDRGHLLIANFNVYGTSFLLPVSTSTAMTDPIAVDVRKNLSHPGLRGPGSEVLTKPPVLATGELVVSDGTLQWWGGFNEGYRWGEIVDQPDRYEITLSFRGRGGTSDVTLRRLQKFRPASGKSYAWQFKTTVTDRQGTKDVVQNGEAAVGDDGLLRIPQVQIVQPPGRLVVTAK